MTNPTSNFGWQMPTSTDLVTDLPADFETFGQAVDTSLADLKGGTSGQILAKASNTDMDFTWITNDVGDITAVTASAPLTGGGTSGAITVGIQDGTTAQKGAVQLSDSTSSTSTTLAATANAVKTTYDLANGAIPKSLIDAAGDLIVGTADNTAGRVAIGTTGQVLTVSGGTAVWSTPAGGSTGPSFSAVSNATQSISAATNTKVTLQVENWDTAGNFASSRFTPTTAGYYQINAGVSYEVGSNNTVRVNIYKNGSQVGLGFSAGFSLANPGAQYVSVVYLNGSTDYVELYAWCESAATVYRGELNGAQVRS
jgi:hypothetical protein